MASRLPPHGPAVPGELTVRLMRLEVQLGAALFVGMAATAMARRFESEGDLDAAAEVAWFRDGMARIVSAQSVGGGSPVTIGAWSQRRSSWIVGTRRLGAHASRIRYRRHDLHVALAWWLSFGAAATAWVCQQPDWRYRWTADGRRRLHFMASCWDAYSRCDFTPADMHIGLADMPLSDESPA